MNSVYFIVRADHTENVGRLFSSACISTWKNDDILNFLLKDVPSIALQNLYRLYTIVNGPYTDISSNAILESFLWAYYRHHDIVLSPDDMWLFSMYVFFSTCQ
jgi:hypothetical protein